VKIAASSKAHVVAIKSENVKSIRGRGKGMRQRSFPTGRNSGARFPLSDKDVQTHVFQVERRGVCRSIHGFMLE